MYIYFNQDQLNFSVIHFVMVGQTTSLKEDNTERTLLGSFDTVVFKIILEMFSFVDLHLGSIVGSIRTSFTHKLSFWMNFYDMRP